MCEFENSDRRQLGKRLDWLPKYDLAGKLIPAENPNNFWARQDSESYRIQLSQPKVSFHPNVAKAVYEMWKQETVVSDDGKLACGELDQSSSSLAALTQEVGATGSVGRRAIMAGERIRAAYAIAEMGVDGEWLYALAVAEARISAMDGLPDFARENAIRLLRKAADNLASGGAAPSQVLWIAHVEKVRAVYQAIVGGWKEKVSNAGANIQKLFSGNSGAANQGDAGSN